MLSTAYCHHDELVTSLVSSPNSQWIASGSDDGTIILWDANGRDVDVELLAGMENGERYSPLDTYERLWGFPTRRQR